MTKSIEENLERRLEKRLSLQGTERSRTEEVKSLLEFERSSNFTKKGAIMYTIGVPASYAGMAIGGYLAAANATSANWIAGGALSCLVGSVCFLPMSWLAKSVYSQFKKKDRLSDLRKNFPRDYQQAVSETPFNWNKTDKFYADTRGFISKPENFERQVQDIDQNGERQPAVLERPYDVKKAGWRFDYLTRRIGYLEKQIGIANKWLQYKTDSKSLTPDDVRNHDYFVGTCAYLRRDKSGDYNLLKKVMDFETQTGLPYLEEAPQNL